MEIGSWIISKNQKETGIDRKQIDIFKGSVLGSGIDLALLSLLVQPERGCDAAQTCSSGSWTSQPYLCH